MDIELIEAAKLGGAIWVVGIFSAVVYAGYRGWNNDTPWAVGAAFWPFLMLFWLVAAPFVGLYRFGDWLSNGRPRPRWLKHFKRPAWLKPKNLEPLCPECKQKTAYR